MVGTTSGPDPPLWRAEAAAGFARNWPTGLRECGDSMSPTRRHETSRSGSPSSQRSPPGLVLPSLCSVPVLLGTRARSWPAQVTLSPGSGGADGLGQIGGDHVQGDLTSAERSSPPTLQDTEERAKREPRTSEDGRPVLGSARSHGPWGRESCQGCGVGPRCREEEACLQGDLRKGRPGTMLAALQRLPPSERWLPGLVTAWLPPSRTPLLRRLPSPGRQKRRLKRVPVPQRP